MLKCTCKGLKKSRSELERKNQNPRRFSTLGSTLSYKLTILYKQAIYMWAVKASLKYKVNILLKTKQTYQAWIS